MNLRRNVQLRPMLPGDLPAALALWRTTDGVGLAPEETEVMLTRYLERNPDLSLVAIAADDSVLGAILCGHDGRRGFLYHLAVARDYRGQGIGRALVEAGLAGLRRCGVAKVSIVVYADNSSGRTFWEHLGWQYRVDLDLMQTAL